MDALAHYHLFDYRARCAVAVTTELVAEAQRRHNLDPLTTIAVGRAISCAALLASTLKAGREYVHCSFAGEGVLAKVIGECNGDGHCRGYCIPERIMDVLGAEGSVPESVGEAMGGGGTLTVTRGLANEGSTYNAIAALQDGEIATDIARYLTESEQIPSAVAAGVKLSSDGKVVAAGGVLVQKLGGAVLPESTLTEVEERLSGHLNLTARIAAGESLDSIVRFIQGTAAGYGILTSRPLVFQCTCSREKMMAALSAFGDEQLRQIRRDTGKIEVRCHYCAETRQFRLEELVQH